MTFSRSSFGQETAAEAKEKAEEKKAAEKQEADEKKIADAKAEAKDAKAEAKADAKEEKKAKHPAKALEALIEDIEKADADGTLPDEDRDAMQQLWKRLSRAIARSGASPDQA